MFGLRHTNIFGMFPVDRLHQDANGVTKYIIEVIMSWLSLSQKAEVTARLRYAKTRGSPRLPSGADVERLCAEERLAIMRVLAWATNGILNTDQVDVLARERVWWCGPRDAGLNQTQPPLYAHSAPTKAARLAPGASTGAHAPTAPSNAIDCTRTPHLLPPQS
jgi:hypothetical protein